MLYKITEEKTIGIQPGSQKDTFVSVKVKITDKLELISLPFNTDLRSFNEFKMNDKTKVLLRPNQVIKIN